MENINWFEVINAVVSVIVLVLVPQVSKFLNHKMDAGKRAQLVTFSKIAVQAAEQTYHQMGGQAKFDKAKELLIDRASELGVNLTDAQLDAIIESAVKEISDVYNKAK
ncbi:holin [Bacillus phage YungSlug]|nr:holin [Bacillus phage YungSlug]